MNAADVPDRDPRVSGNSVEGKVLGAACGCVTSGSGKLTVNVEKIKVMRASPRARQHPSGVPGDGVARKASRKGARLAGASRGQGPSAHVGLFQRGRLRAHWLDLSPGRDLDGVGGDNAMERDRGNSEFLVVLHLRP